MRRLALAALCGVCALGAAAVTDAANNTKAATAKSSKIAQMDVDELKAQIPQLQQIGEQIARNREAFKKLRIQIERERAAKRAFHARQRGWSHPYNMKRTQHAGRFNPTRPNNPQGLSHSSLKPKAAGAKTSQKLNSGSLKQKPKTTSSLQSKQSQKSACTKKDARTGKTQRSCGSDKK